MKVLVLEVCIELRQDARLVRSPRVAKLHALGKGFGKFIRQSKLLTSTRWSPAVSCLRRSLIPAGTPCVPHATHRAFEMPCEAPGVEDWRSKHAGSQFLTQLLQGLQ